MLIRVAHPERILRWPPVDIIHLLVRFVIRGAAGLHQFQRLLKKAVTPFLGVCADDGADAFHHPWLPMVR